MRGKTILILWDYSHIWGLMALRAMRGLGLPCRLVKAIEISQGGGLGKRALPERHILLVPGGNARQKARALGPRGKESVRRFVEEGGLYLGFCGGAGLALSEGAASLELCPLKRARFEKRFYHFLSGHVLARTEGGAALSLPVWWPGRFAMENSPDIAALARYDEPGSDLWLADVPLARIPTAIAASWAKSRGLQANLGFPEGEPLIIRGGFGSGDYILSYAHLETPDSPQANRLLRALLEEYGDLPSKGHKVPQWRTFNMDYRGEGPAAENRLSECAKKAHARTRGLCENGLELGLLFQRKDWLLGWRAGFSGMACNNLLAALSFISEISGTAPSSAAAAFLEKFPPLFDRFMKEAEDWLWTYRLDLALNPGSPAEELVYRQHGIFGHPMLGGGLAGKLLEILEDFVWASRESLEADL